MSQQVEQYLTDGLIALIHPQTDHKAVKHTRLV